ncbi:MAG: asparaginase domain-containing protein [Synergistaceae bacterium]|jgi:L-asparaginase|nr:asparaginase domain-containing protein [Synergistaceae bacterium]
MEDIANVPNRDKISLILAGGEIIHKRVSLGAEVEPLEGEELTAGLSAEIKEKVFVVDWSYQPMSHYTLRMCSDLLQLAGTQIENGSAGVAISAGTQSLTEVAYFASLVWNYPQPLVFVASIVCANTRGAETELRLNQAVQSAASQSCWGQGPLICVQDELYAAADLCQLSNYSRTGFVALPCGPLAKFCEPRGDLKFLRSTRRSGRIMDIGTLPARNVEILDASLGGGDILLSALVESRVAELDGLVISAFGGGDVPPSWAPLLRKIVRANVPVVLASRCPMGRVQPGQDFEGASARLLEMGLISAGSLTSLQARIRLSMGLGAELKDQELRAWMLDE